MARLRARGCAGDREANGRRDREAGNRRQAGPIGLRNPSDGGREGVPRAVVAPDAGKTTRLAGVRLCHSLELPAGGLQPLVSRVEPKSFREGRPCARKIAGGTE